MTNNTGFTTRNGTDARQAKIATANRFQTIIAKVQNWGIHEFLSCRKFKQYLH